MTEEQALSHAEGLALSMGITFYVVRSRDGDFELCNCHRTTARSPRRWSHPAARTRAGNSTAGKREVREGPGGRLRLGALSAGSTLSPLAGARDLGCERVGRPWGALFPVYVVANASRRGRETSLVLDL